jgi:hypothetical protein
MVMGPGGRPERPDRRLAYLDLKYVLHMRPVFHQPEERVRAHIFLAALALLVHRALERKLKTAGMDLSATQALGALKTVRLIDIARTDGKTTRCIANGSPGAAAISRAVGIKNLHRLPSRLLGSSV